MKEPRITVHSLDDWDDVQLLKKLEDSADWEVMFFDEEIPLIALAHKRTYEYRTWGDPFYCLKYGLLFDELIHRGSLPLSKNWLSLRSRMYARLAQ